MSEENQTSDQQEDQAATPLVEDEPGMQWFVAVSYTHLRAHRDRG